MTAPGDPPTGDPVATRDGPVRRPLWSVWLAGAAVGLLGGLVGLGGAEFRLPLLIGFLGLAALQAVVVKRR